MPRLKRQRSRFTVKRKLISKGTGLGRWPAKHRVPVVASIVENGNEIPLPLEEKAEELEFDVEEDEVEIESRLPMMFCVVCYNKFTSYNIKCLSWEEAMAKDFYVAMNIPSAGHDDDSIISLPFCPECHSKVSVMFSVHQQLQSILQRFNCTRNDLAFTIVESINKNCHNGPLDLIRQQVFERWKNLYKSSKEKKTCNVRDGERDEYLDPALSVNQDWPVDHKSMALAANIKNKKPVMKDEAVQDNIVKKSTDDGTNELDLDDTNLVSPVKVRMRKSLLNKPFKGAPFKPKVTAKKLVKVKGEKKKRVPEMPKLLPMEKLPTKPRSGISSFRKTLNARKVNGTNYGNKIVPSKSALLKQSLSKGKAQLLKKQTGSSKAMSLLKTLDSKKVKHLKKKPPVQLVDGTWKCPYCPKIYQDLVRVKRHEGLAHPNTRPFICHMCSNGFSSALTLRRHLQIVHHQAIEGFAKCPYCEKSFGKKYAFELHIRTLHKGQTIPDYYCVPPGHPSTTVKLPMVSPPSPEITDLESLGSSSPENNSSKGNPKPLASLKRKSIMDKKLPKKREKTEVPPKVGKNKNGSNDSKGEDILNSEPALINKASKMSNGKQELMGKDCPNSIAPFSCLMCNIAFVTEALLENHNTLMHEINNTKCTTCDVEFSTEPELRKHRLDEHGQVGATCPICGKWYAKHQSLGGHMHIHRRAGVIWEKNGSGCKSRKSVASTSSN